ncbi:putative 26S proteasome regulatory subunit p27 [Primulina tabacum]|uniref:putative 26S proteasome regulatory subunit p27 n=1 Tax=Primulina tabacum TaxID=48773 RepID=UPI003F5A50CA
MVFAYFVCVSAKLQNDNDITDKINQNIQLLHSAKLAIRDSDYDMDMDIAVSRPFAMIDEITEAYPAAEDGLQLRDQIVKFGNVELCENLLQRLAAEVQKNQSQVVPLLVMRQGALITLTVTPRAWLGSRLLGSGGVRNMILAGLKF